MRGCSYTLVEPGVRLAVEASAGIGVGVGVGVGADTGGVSAGGAGSEGVDACASFLESSIDGAAAGFFELTEAFEALTSIEAARLARFHSPVSSSRLTTVWPMTSR